LKYASRVHLLTATKTQFAEDLHKVLCEQKSEDALFIFKSKEQYANSKRQMIQRSLRSYPNKRDETLTAFRETIDKESKTQPLIIFVEQDENLWVEELTQKYACADCEVVYIDTDEKAIAQRGRDKFN